MRDWDSRGRSSASFRGRAHAFLRNTALASAAPPPSGSAVALVGRANFERRETSARYRSESNAGYRLAGDDGADSRPQRPSCQRPVSARQPRNAEVVCPNHSRYVGWPSSLLLHPRGAFLAGCVLRRRVGPLQLLQDHGRMGGVRRPASARPATVRGIAKHAQAAQPAAPRAEETPDRWTAGASPTEGPSPRKSPTSGGKSPRSPRGETRGAALSQLQTRDRARHSPRSAALRSPTITSDDELRGEDPPISTVMRSRPENQRLRRPSRRRERGGSCAASCAPGDSRSNRKGPF